MSVEVQRFMRNLAAILMLAVVTILAGCDSQQPPKANPTTATKTPPTIETDKQIESSATDSTQLSPGSAVVDSDQPDGATAPDPDGAADVLVTPIDAAGLQAAVDKHPGKVVLVDCWATWCFDCVKDFPHTVEMSKKYADQGLVVMSLSFDDLTDEKRMQKVREFLAKQNATFKHYISRLDLEKDGAEAFQIEDGALPHYKLYGRDGKLLKALTNADPDNPLSHADLEAVVEEALK